MAGPDLRDRKKVKQQHKSRRIHSKPIVFPSPNYIGTISKTTTTTTTTLEFNYTRRNSIMSSSTQPGEGVTALMLACLQNRVTDVQLILKKNKDSCRSKTKSGKVPLHFCAEGGSRRCLELLLSADPDLINCPDEEGYTPLHYGVINGNKEVVKSLILASANVNCVDHEKHSLVHWATVCGELEVLDILLNSGSPAATPDIHLAHPIHYASQMCGNNGQRIDSRARVQSTVHGVSPKKVLAILQRLVRQGVPVDVKDKDGRQPLLWASSAGSSDGILCLVNAGASVQAEDKDGLTALHCAASRGHTDCLETLIALCGSEVDVIDNNGCSAIFYAVTLGHADCTELLLNFGADPNRQDRKGRTPAHCGASKGQLETIKLISKHGGNLWMKNVRGDLPLHEAILSRRKDLVLWLLSQRPEAVNAPNNDGRCPIHLAALNNNVEMVKILIDHNIDINPLMRTSKGIAMTPLDAAIHKGNSAVAKFLQLHGGLPANSLHDSALQRRIRNSESQARSVSSLRGSQFGNHHESSPDPELLPFTSPEIPEVSIIHDYVDNIVTTILKESTAPAPSPSMDDGVQTDSRQFLRDMQTQVSYEEEANSQKNGEDPQQAVRGTATKVKKKRKSMSKEKSPTVATESTDSGDPVETVSTLPRSSRRSKPVKTKSPKNTLPAEDVVDSKAEEQKVEQVHQTSAPLIESGTKSADVRRDRKSAKNETQLPEPPEDGSGESSSEKCSELEKVIVQSSESEIREEELGALEPDTTIEKNIIARPCSSDSRGEPLNVAKEPLDVPKKPLDVVEKLVDLPNAPLDVVEKLVDVPKEPLDVTEKLVDVPKEPLDVTEKLVDLPKEPLDVAEKLVDLPKTPLDVAEKLVDLPKTPLDVAEKLVDLPKTPLDVAKKLVDLPQTPLDVAEKLDDVPIEPLDVSEKLIDVPKEPLDVAQKPMSDNEVQRVMSTVEEESRVQSSTTCTTSTSSYKTTETPSVDENETSHGSTPLLDKGQRSEEKVEERETVSPSRNESQDQPDSLTSKESRDQETETRSDDTDATIRLDEISLQEAYARRRRSKFQRSTQSSTKSELQNQKVGGSGKSGDPSTPEREKPRNETSSKFVHSDSAKSTERLSVREQFKANREILERKSAAAIPAVSTPRSKSKKLPQNKEILLQEKLLGESRSPRNSIRVRKSSNKIPKSTPPTVLLVQETTNQKSSLALPGKFREERVRNISEGKLSTQSEDTPHSWKMDSGYSDQLHPTTSASEDQNKINLRTPKSPASLRRKVISRRPGSGTTQNGKRNGNLSGKNKIHGESRAVKERRDFGVVGIQQRPRLPPLENGSAGSTSHSHAGSVTSEEGFKKKEFKRPAKQTRAKLTFTKGEDLNALMSPYQKKNMDVDTPISVTQAMQASMRKYQLERKIFQELLELKRLQIRAGKANEQVLVKRLADGYKKAGLSINYREYDGAYTFRNFEKYLYEQLRLLQANRKLLPRFAPSDDLEKLSLALKKMNATKLPFLDDIERAESTCLEDGRCSHLTHRCHHASHAYVGIPCAAYISKGRRTPFLPKVDANRAPGPINRSHTPLNSNSGVQMIISPRNDASSPITVEVQQGSNSQVFTLPNNTLDPSKNYYVSLSIKPSASPVETKVTSSSSIGNHANVPPEDSGSLSAPPPPVNLKGN